MAIDICLLNARGSVGALPVVDASMKADLPHHDDGIAAPNFSEAHGG